MAVCACCSKVSTADSLVLAAIQIMIGIFCVFMWYLLLVLYMGQIKGVFGTYEPITYKTGCSLWGIVYILSGISIIRVTRHPSQRQLTCAMLMNILCIIITVIAMILTVAELSTFESVSYRNYGQAPAQALPLFSGLVPNHSSSCVVEIVFPVATNGICCICLRNHNHLILKLGREISRVLLSFYPLELCIAFTYTIFGCVGLCRKKEDAQATVTEEVEDAF